jgi:hypothetical protein
MLIGRRPYLCEKNHQPDLRQCDQFHDSKYAREFFGKKRDALWLLKEEC